MNTGDPSLFYLALSHVIMQIWNVLLTLPTGVKNFFLFLHNTTNTAEGNSKSSSYNYLQAKCFLRYGFILFSKSLK